MSVAEATRRCIAGWHRGSAGVIPRGRAGTLIQVATFRQHASPSTTYRGARTTVKRLAAARSIVKHPNQSGLPAPQQGGQLPTIPPQRSGFLGAIADGLAHGVGWAFGMRAVDALFGPRTLDISHSGSHPTTGVDDANNEAVSGHSDPSSTSSSFNQADDSFQSQFGQSDFGQEGWRWGNDDSGNGSGTGWGDFDLDG